MIAGCTTTATALRVVQCTGQMVAIRTKSDACAAAWTTARARALDLIKAAAGVPTQVSQCARNLVAEYLAHAIWFATPLLHTVLQVPMPAAWIQRHTQKLTCVLRLHASVTQIQMAGVASTLTRKPAATPRFGTRAGGLIIPTVWGRPKSAMGTGDSVRPHVHRRDDDCRCNASQSSANKIALFLMG